MNKQRTWVRRERERTEMGLLIHYLKWVIGVGLGLAFVAGVWATTLQANVSRVEQKVDHKAAADSAIVAQMSRLAWATDSLRLEMSHLTRELRATP